MFNPFENRKQMTQGTETLGGPRATIVIRHKETEHIALGFENNTGDEIFQGQEITLDTDGSIKLRTAGNEYPLGIVQVGAKDGKRLVAATPFVAVVNAKNKKGSTINAGELVKVDGTIDAFGKPGYKPVAAGDYASGIALEQVANNGEVAVGIFRTPVQSGATPDPANGQYYVASIIKATNVSQTIDFGDLAVADIVLHVKAANGQSTVRTIGVVGTLGEAAVVDDYYFVYRAL